MDQSGLAIHRWIRKIERCIGGEVWLAELSNGELVAVKNNDLTFIRTRPVVENPVREAAIHELLWQKEGADKCIVGFRGCLRSNGEIDRSLQPPDTATLHVVTEFLAGPELFRYVSARERPLPLDEVVALMRQMVSSAMFVHRNGYCHLDLSLENFRFQEDTCDPNGLRLLDFGVTTALTGQRLPPFRRALPGKARYMAPEIYLRQSFDGIATDVWSLGVCLYMMVTGHELFRLPDRTDHRFAFYSASRHPKALALLTPSLETNELGLDLLQRMLKVDASQRISLENVLTHPFLTLRL